jgi:hypothetical protein
MGLDVIQRLEEQEKCVAATSKSDDENHKVIEGLKAIKWIVS